MTQAISFEQYRPPPRFDAIPWTQARIDEAATEDGPWATIDTLPLSPVDTDPENPQFRDFTTTLASDAPDLWYRIVFVDALADVSLPTIPVQNTDPGVARAGGPCTDWIDADDVANCCDTTDSTDTSLFERVAAQASDLMFTLSGRAFAGECEQTVRPCRTRCGCGGQVLSRGHLVGWDGFGWCGGGSPCGCRADEQVTLAGYPVRQIVEVKIDGEIVDEDTYTLRRRRHLVRLRDPDDPNTVLRWPSCQSMDLDDTQEGTFSVTYTYGKDPPLAGINAAAQLACELYKQCTGQECALPRNTTRATRQGITIETPAFAMWAFQRGGGWNTGIALVDIFLNGYARTGLPRKPTFWSSASTLQYPVPSR